MDETRFKHELIARLDGELDRNSMQMVEAALLVVLRNYDVKKKETQLRYEYDLYPILGRIPPLLSEVKVGDECRLFFY